VGEHAAKETLVVKDKEAALDFLHARGSFQRRAAGLPAVVVLGSSLHRLAAFALLKEIRADTKLRRLPVVMVAAAPDADMVKNAYEHGVNSLVRRPVDINLRTERYATLALFWAWANEPPPGSRQLPKSPQPAA
jgi:CheY-like chemotaxis protein